MKQPQQQKGSLLVEVLAVLGLIALITPLLYQQINRRNEEIGNINIATEIRAIKDAVAAYIQANEIGLTDDCNAMWSNGNRDLSRTSSGPANCGTIDFSNIGDYTTVSEAAVNAYNIRLYGYWVDSGFENWVGCDACLDANPSCCPDNLCNIGTCAACSSACAAKYTPVIYGVISEESAGGKTLRRSARIASLIGLDGGVMTGNNIIEGMDGAWQLSTSVANGFVNNAVAATTSFEAATRSALLTDVQLNVFRGDTAQANAASFGRLHAPEFFSVGQGNQNCVALYGSTQGTLNVLAASGSCNPVFQVDGSGNVIRLNALAKIDVNKIAFSNNPSTVSSGNAITADALGDEKDTVLQGVDPNKYVNYQLDPAYTSVMNDIRLTSRGGARLSDILPNYILKEMGRINGNNTTYNHTITKPMCPAGYLPALLLSPARQVQDRIDVNALVGKMYIASSVSTGSGSGSSTTTLSLGGSGYYYPNGGLYLNIAATAESFYPDPTAATTSDETWAVKVTRYPGAANDTASRVITSAPAATPFTSYAFTYQTFCFFDPTAHGTAGGDELYPIPDKIRPSN